MTLSKDKMREYMRKRRRESPSYAEQIKKDSIRNIKKNRNLKRKAAIYKGDKCSACNKQYDDVCYDFHHIDPTTKEHLITANFLRYPWPQVKTELDKCVLVCSNCHRIIHKRKDIHGPVNQKEMF